MLNQESDSVSQTGRDYVGGIPEEDGAIRLALYKLVLLVEINVVLF